MDIDSDEEIVTRPLIYSSPRALPIRRSNTPVHGKRQAEAFIVRTDPPPLKRRKGDFISAYLNLLNQDIRDASSGVINGSEDDSELESTQIGAVKWSAAEKTALFAALSRLGKDDLTGISARIGTKGELEVRQFLLFLDAHPRGANQGKRGALRPVDIPAAVEIGAECAASLEAAADGLSLRQESYEEELERERWGSRWLITPPLARILEDAVIRSQEPRPETSPPRDGEGRRERARMIMKRKEEEGDDEVEEEWEEKANRNCLEEMPFLQLLPVHNWLRLSDRVFMNSTVSDGNWHAISEEDARPAIQATALADFHGLVISVTRRLLLAAMYVAESRIRTRSLAETLKRRRGRLRVEDVHAAVSSLGMKRDSREFWARCARRLRLDVVDHGTDDDDDVDEQEDEDIGTDEDENEDENNGMDIDTEMSLADSSSENTGDTDQGAEQSDQEEEDDDDYATMNYDEVEAALGYPAENHMRSRPSSPDSGALPSPGEDISSSDSADELQRENQRMEMEAEEEDDNNEGLNTESIKRDIEEAMISQTPLEYPDDDDDGETADQLHSTLRALKSRIRIEHRLERDAERADAVASADAEARLWAVLRGDGDVKSKGRR
ncbi:hypothetical protein F5Y03DRAFT_129263 [Xylaria venustula]|nr:hypothetical protein F5Y03DRAFT_129263 [Xylaria venustula]